jgi:hypothetical protein
MSSNAKLNYLVDVVIGVAFILSALSGLILFVFPSGYQGGRNPYYGRTVLFLTTHAWSELHTWGSLAMIVGVGGHLLLHWRWMVCMTGKLLKGVLPAQPKAEACPIE